MTGPELRAVPRAEVSEPQLKSVRAAGRWRGQMRTDVAVRSFTVRTDEPEAVGGTDAAPTPMEVIAAAVDGCITVVIETVAAELGLTVSALETDSHAHLDVRGFLGTAEVSPHFHDYLLTITLDVDGDDDSRGELIRLSEQRCPALNLVRDAGLEMVVDWRVGTVVGS